MIITGQEANELPKKRTLAGLYTTNSMDDVNKEVEMMQMSLNGVAMPMKDGGDSNASGFDPNAIQNDYEQLMLLSFILIDLQNLFRCDLLNKHLRAPWFEVADDIQDLVSKGECRDIYFFLAIWWAVWVYGGQDSIWCRPGPCTGDGNPNLLFMALKMHSTLLLQLVGGGVIIYQYNVCYSLSIHLLHNH